MNKQKQWYSDLVSSSSNSSGSGV